MKSVSIRELSHHLSPLLKEVKLGERLIILERNIPIAELVPHRENITKPGWNRPIKRVRGLKKTFLESLEEERYEKS